LGVIQPTENRSPREDETNMSGFCSSIRCKQAAKGKEGLMVLGTSVAEHQSQSILPLVQALQDILSSALAIGFADQLKACPGRGRDQLVDAFFDIASEDLVQGCQ
jgi:hypothetical protein